MFNVLLYHIEEHEAYLACSEWPAKLNSALVTMEHVFTFVAFDGNLQNFLPQSLKDPF